MAANPSTPSYNQVKKTLINGNLREACVFMSNIHHTLPSTQSISDQAELLTADIDRMLDHYAQGGIDPQREALREQTAERAWLLAEQLYDVEAPLRTIDTDMTVANAVDALKDELVDDLLLGTAFETIVECRHLSRDDRNALGLAMLDESLPEYVRATLLSAIALHLMQWFDAELIESLYVYTFDDQPQQIQMQAWVALTLVAFVHKHRIANLPRLKEEYRLICENEGKLLDDIQKELLMCREAHFANKRVTEMVDRFEEDDDDETKNSNLKELFGMLNEGVDMSFNVFKKQAKLPFFSRPELRHHWLQPFSLEQPQMKTIFDSNPKALPWVKMMMQSVAQCETDKYATVLTMQGMGGGQLMSAIGQKLEDSGLRFEDIVPTPPLFVMRNYLHDLYRYYTLNPTAKQMRNNPFDGDLLMCMNPWLADAATDTTRLASTAELLLRKERWSEAAKAYELLSTFKTSEQVIQRLAYAYLKDPDSEVERAIKPLQRCHRLFPENLWTAKHLADSLHSLNELIREEDVLNKALEFHPDNVGLLTRLGCCLNDQKRYQEALKPLFRADMTKEGRRNTQRELARALLATRDFDRAMQYAQRATKHSKTTQSDFIMYGIVALQRGNIPLAIAQFAKAQPILVSIQLGSNRQLLNNLGVSDNDIDLICELMWRQADNQKTNNQQ